MQPMNDNPSIADQDACYLALKARDARFDGRPAGWLVCPPGSAHRPTVSQGRALVLYLLPQGQIEFTR